MKSASFWRLFMLHTTQKGSKGFCKTKQLQKKNENRWQPAGVRAGIVSQMQPLQQGLKINSAGVVFLSSSSQTPHSHTILMLRKITSFAPGLDFIYYFRIISAHEDGSTGEGEATGRRPEGAKDEWWKIQGRVLQSLGGLWRNSGSRILQEPWN